MSPLGTLPSPWDALARWVAAECGGLAWTADGHGRVCQWYDGDGTAAAGRPVAEALAVAEPLAPLLTAHARALEGEFASCAFSWRGSVHQGHVSPWHGEDGQVIGCRGLALPRRGPMIGLSDAQRLFDLSLAMLCVAGLDGYFRAVNPAFERALGYSREELLARPLLDFVHPDDREATTAELGRLAQGAPTTWFENRYRGKDGLYRWLAWTAMPHPESGLIYATAHDITARKHAEDLFRGLFEFAPDPTILVDGEGVIVGSNALAERLFGYEAGELLGQPIEVLVPVPLRAVHQRQRSGYSRQPHPRPMGAGMELRALRKDGSEFPAEISLGYLPTEAGLIVFTAIRDITARKRAERALRESEERFALAAQGTDVGIWDWDLRTGEVYYSPRWKSILGYAEEEIGSSYLEWETRLHPADHARALETVRAYLDGKNTRYELEHRLRHKDGSYRWIVARGAAVRDQNGAPYRMVGSHLDVTEQKAAAEALRQREAELEAAQEVQRRLLPGRPPALEGVELAGMLVPAEFTAGDYFDFFALPDGSLMIAIGDVSGHGLGPALLMASVHTLVRVLAPSASDVGEVLSQANEFLVRETGDDRFVTMFLGHFDPAQRLFTYSNAGHPNGYVFSRAGDVRHVMPSDNLPLGIDEDTRYCPAPPIALAPGDLILLVTDGVLETRSPAGEDLGEARVQEAVRATLGRPVEEILAAISATAREFSRAATSGDDFTAVVVRVR